MNSLMQRFPNLRRIVIERHGKQIEGFDTDGLPDEGLDSVGVAQNCFIHLEFANFLANSNTPKHIQIIYSPVKRCVQTANSLSSRLKGVFSHTTVSLTELSCLDVEQYEELEYDKDTGKTITKDWLSSMMSRILSALQPETDTCVIVAHGPHGRYLPKEFVGSSSLGNLSRLTEEDVYQLRPSEMLIIDTQGKYDFLIYDD
jgi:phosphohistidine phosphatase SixA